jgi:hypothetical protein
MYDLKFWEGFAPIITATIAFSTACIAVWALRSQLDMARRRATIDFFVKTEMDEKLIDAYNEFRSELPNVEAVVSRSVIKDTDEDYRRLIKWLNVCELLAVGIRLRAFSDTIAFDYWGYVIPDAYRKSLPFINRVRETPNLGAGPMSLCDLEHLSNEWAKRDETSGARSSP